FKLTSDGFLSLCSEVGVNEVDDFQVVQKGRLAPGEILSVDTATGRVRFNEEIRQDLATRRPYAEWLRANRIELSKIAPRNLSAPDAAPDIAALTQRQAAFGYSWEELDMAFAPMLRNGIEATYSMGDDAPLPVLSLSP